jgi:hypothetical protein
MNHQRFIVAAPGEFDPDLGALVILCDYKFWTQHQAELAEWCSKHHAWHQGMTVSFPDLRVLDWFVLRWS